MYKVNILYVFTLLHLFLVFSTHIFQTSSSIPSYSELEAEATKISDYIVRKKHLLQENPSINPRGQEPSKVIQDVLKENGISFTQNLGVDKNHTQIIGNGIIAQIGTGHPPCVGLRADIDGQMSETRVDSEMMAYSMLGANHDVHTAMLLGAAKILKKYENQIPGTVKLIFQSAEEGAGEGAKFISNELTQTHPSIQNMFGMHVDSGQPTGKLSSAPGYFRSGCIEFSTLLNGKGGHAGTPHLTIDTITTSSEIIQAINDIAAREVNFKPENTADISFKYIQPSSEALNVVPDMVSFGGTISAFNSTLLEHICKRIKSVTEEIAKAHECTAEFHSGTPYPPIYNDVELFDFFQNVASEASSDGQVQTLKHSTGNKKFAFFPLEAPSLQITIGSGTGDNTPDQPAQDTPVHSSSFSKEMEKLLPNGSALYSHFAFQRLQYLSDKMKALEQINEL